MCGIVAVRDTHPQGVDLQLLARMAATIRHRGPDGHGLWHGRVGIAEIGLAHHRLAIINHGGSHQPMVTADGRHVLIFNGEVLNFQELRSTLIHSPVDGGDAAVLLQGLVDHGPRFLLEVRGQFAFVLADTFTGEMTAGRDPLGILPLLYAQVLTPERKRIVLASEASAILADPAFTPAIAEDSLSSYLMQRSIPAPRTLLAGIHKVRPGHLLTITPDGTVREVSYWSPVMHLDSGSTAGDIPRLLQRGVDRALVADSPIGVFLSGGLDSTLLTALVQRRLSTVATYCASFEGARDDESIHAEWAAHELGSRHRTVRISPSVYAETIGPMSRGRDSPLSEPADLGLHHVAQHARMDVSVALSGEGADELFSGYPKYRVARAARVLSHIPGLRASTQYLNRGRRLRSTGVHSVLRVLSEPDQRRQRRGWLGSFNTDEVHRLTGGSTPDCTPNDGRREAGGSGELQQMAIEDLTGWLPDNLLSRADRMCMAAGLEVRPPFLDLDLVEAALALPFREKVHRGRTKWPLRQMASQLLPTSLSQSVLNRPKSGFSVPLDTWFRGGLRDLLNDRLMPQDCAASTLLDHSEMRRMLIAHDRRRGHHGLQLWTLLSLEVWLQELPHVTGHW